MNAEDMVKSIGITLAFSGFAWFSDAISMSISALHQSIFSALISAVSGPQVIVTGLVGIGVWIADQFLGTNIINNIQGMLLVVFSLQILVSIFTLCVFYAIVLSSPKGTYTVSDCLAAAGIFLLESIPVLCGFTFWGGFAAYLKRREISGVTEKFASAVGLSGIDKQGGGVISKALSSIKR